MTLPQGHCPYCELAKTGSSASFYWYSVGVIPYIKQAHDTGHQMGIQNLLDYLESSNTENL